jgi:hypothetical protein
MPLGAGVVAFARPAPSPRAETASVPAMVASAIGAALNDPVRATTRCVEVGVPQQALRRGQVGAARPHRLFHCRTGSRCGRCDHRHGIPSDRSRAMSRERRAWCAVVAETPEMPLSCTNPCSPGWTRTSNPSVNSRTLCQLSYRGSCATRDDSSVRGGCRAKTHVW